MGVLGQAWPVPFWDGKAKGYRAQLIVGYRGYVELAHRSEKVQSLMPRVVYENDEFDIDYGVGGTLVHKPAKGKRGAPVGYHAIVRYRNGGYDFIFMTADEMIEHRDKFATTRNKDGVIFGPWIDHPEAMGQKTTLRLLTKYVPMSPQMERAAYVDGGLRIDLNHLNRPEEVTEQPRVLEHDEDPGPEDPRTPPEGPITDGQRKHLMALANDVGWGKDRDQRMAYIREKIGRDVQSSNQLTAAEADMVIQPLARYAKEQAGPEGQ